MCEPQPTTDPTTQNTGATPASAPAAPNSIGISTLEALMLIKRRPKASPWRCGGVIWCKVLMIMGWAVPKTSPSKIEHKPMAQGEGMRG